VSLSKQTTDNNSIKNLEKAWSDLAQSGAMSAHADEALQLAHALAKSYEDLGDYDTSISWLKKGKATKLVKIQDRSAEDAALFSASQSSAKALDITPDATEGGPIFIVGMPRTGTTLLDRIITSHPDFEPAGELSDFSIALKRHAQTEGPFVLDEATLESAAKINLSPVGEDYLAQVKASLGITGRFTDKMPLNFFFAPAILAAIPNARVISLRRHPADTMISNYRQLFATNFSYYAYAYDLEKTAEYVVRFNTLLSEFEKHLPVERFKVVNYEDLVLDLEPQARDIIKFCGLAWDDQCLAFHENTAPVATASSTQVRKKLYTTSMQRWKRYSGCIDAGLNILRDAGVMTD
jgi:tetratricopeptide (TPR) repeat protein